MSRTNGGKVDWIPVANLPPQVRAAVSQLGQGQVSDPVPLPGAVGLFIGALAFEKVPALAAATKIGVLAGSVLSAVFGYVVLHLAGRHLATAEEPAPVAISRKRAH